MKLLLAVSGGIDSMYMLKRALEGALFDYTADFSVAHCNFSLRGKESDEDEEFVKNWCIKHNVECFTICFDTASFAQEKGISIEMAARELRYCWFSQLCLNHGFDAVCVAHNAEDNVETMLLNMLRSCGSKGMCGMAADSGRFPSRILRPILSESREHIYKKMLEWGESWREDRTNSEDIYKRNALRHKVLPVFKDLNPSYLKTIAEDMAHIKEVDDIASDYYTEHKDKLKSIPELKNLKHWRYLLYRYLSEYNFPTSTINDLCDLLESNRTISGKTFLSSSHRVDLSSKELFISALSNSREKKEISADSTSSEDKPKSESNTTGYNCKLIEVPGEYYIAGRKFSIKRISYPKNLKAPSGVLYLNIEFPFTLRRWKDGDSMQPLGMKGRKKISDLLVDLKIPAHKKDSVVVLESQKDIMALLPYRISEKVKITPNNKSESFIEISETTLDAPCSHP